MLGSTAEARSLSDRGKALIDELGPSVFSVVARGQTCCYVEMYAGDAAAAEREARHSYQFLDGYGDRVWLSTLAAMLAQATYAQERWTEAERYMQVANEAAASDDLDAQIRWRGVGARLLARTGRMPDAERMARDALRLAETTDFLDVHADALVVHAEVLALQGRRVEAADALAAALALYERKGNLVSADQARALLADLEAGTRTLHWLLPVSRRMPA
jgi:GNAT superfamily N-acetyltransferase